MPRIQTILTPALFPLHSPEGKAVVVIDILRATSSICVAFAHGASRIMPVASPAESMSFRELGFICAAERDGRVVEGFELGNSPFSYMRDEIHGASIALTTTNGTHAIHLSKDAAVVIIGSFLNLDAVCHFLKQENRDVLLLCSGWKNNFNLEDTLYAGALCEALKGDFEIADDAGIAAMDLYEKAGHDLNAYIQKSSHAHRFASLGITEDIAFCMQKNIYTVVPVLKGEFLVVPEASPNQF